MVFHSFLDPKLTSIFFEAVPQSNRQEGPCSCWLSLAGFSALLQPLEPLRNLNLYECRGSNRIVYVQSRKGPQAS